MNFDDMDMRLLSNNMAARVDCGSDFRSELSDFKRAYEDNNEKARLQSYEISSLLKLRQISSKYFNAVINCESYDDLLDIMMDHDFPRHFAELLLDSKHAPLMLTARMVAAKSFDEIMSVLSSVRSSQLKFSNYPEDKNHFISRLIFCALRHRKIDRIFFEKYYKYGFVKSSFGASALLMLLLHPDCPKDLVTRHRKRVLRVAKPGLLRKQREDRKRIALNKEVLKNLRIVLSLIFHDDIPSDLVELLNGFHVWPLVTFKSDIAAIGYADSFLMRPCGFELDGECDLVFPYLQLSMSIFERVSGLPDFERRSFSVSQGGLCRSITEFDLQAERDELVSAYSKLCGISDLSEQCSVEELVLLEMNGEILINRSKIYDALISHSVSSQSIDLVNYILERYIEPIDIIHIKSGESLGFKFRSFDGVEFYSFLTYDAADIEFSVSQCGDS